MKFSYPENTIGKGASYSWEGRDGAGSMMMFLPKKMIVLSKKMNFDGADSEVNWN
jgi:hypothetical protein